MVSPSAGEGVAGEVNLHRRRRWLLPELLESMTASIQLARQRALQKLQPMSGEGVVFWSRIPIMVVDGDFTSRLLTLSKNEVSNVRGRNGTLALIEIGVGFSYSRIRMYTVYTGSTPSTTSFPFL